MSYSQRQMLAPFFSVTFIIAACLFCVFVKMESLRMGYEILRLGRMQKIAADDKALYEVQYAKLIRPERLDQIGTERLALGRAQKNQVILMAATGGYAIRQ